MKIGIVGLPNVGKSTLFQAITQKKVNISNYPFCTIDPNVGIATIPDKRLERIAEIVKPEKIIPAVVEFVDIAGLVKGAHKGEGLGNQFLSYIYTVDAILLVIRCFENKKIIHIENEIDPSRDFEIIKNELKLKSEELTQKPLIKVCNIKSEGDNKDFENCDLELDFKLELEMSEMNTEELKELELKPKINEVIKLSYKTLGLLTFYTIKGGKELRASSLKNGLNAPEAGGKIHSDFQEKFIRAEVLSFDDFSTIKNTCPEPKQGLWFRAREKGLLRTEGRDYVVKDGDIIEFLI
ncbi:DUF933 domain-containing protein [Patescibacteria group bacterium]